MSYKGGSNIYVFSVSNLSGSKSHISGYIKACLSNV
jgi:hypothetical protein